MTVAGGAPAPGGIVLSVVVACFNMGRELPRTLHSLSGAYQRGIDPKTYEVIVVDNGSDDPPREEDFAHLTLNLRIVRQPDPTPSPARALNTGIALCSGEVIGVMIDGARIVSPGLLCACLHAARSHEKAVVYTQGLHLGPGGQWNTIQQGYDQAEEDRLLASIDWPSDGYRLFEVSTGRHPDPSLLAANERPSETDGLFMPAGMWKAIGGYDPVFDSPGGGYVSADTFVRACETPGAQLILISGEATFHQMHHRSTASASADMVNQLKRFSREYHHIRQRPLRPFAGTYWVFGVTRPRTVRRFAQLAEPGVSERYVELLTDVLINRHGQEMALAAQSAGASPLRVEHLRRKTDAFLKNGAAPTQEVGAYSLLGTARLGSLASQIETVLDDQVPGDVMECGVWRGGACILMAGVLASRNVRDRAVWLADSFAGLPPPGPEDEGVDLTAETWPILSVGLDAVKANFERFGLLNERVHFLEGWFADTLPAAPVKQLAILRLDGDLHSSTTQALEALYDKVSPGGFVIIDDYGAITQCARAVTEFRERRGIQEPLHRIDWTGAYWRKGQS